MESNRFSIQKFVKQKERKLFSQNGRIYQTKQLLFLFSSFDNSFLRSLFSLRLIHIFSPYVQTNKFCSLFCCNIQNCCACFFRSSGFQVNYDQFTYTQLHEKPKSISFRVTHYVIVVKFFAQSLLQLLLKRIELTCINLQQVEKRKRLRKVETNKKPIFLPIIKQFAGVFYSNHFFFSFQSSYRVGFVRIFHPG